MSQKIKILVLIKDLSTEVQDYFGNEQFQLLEREAIEDYTALDYILVNNLEDAQEVSREFAASVNNIEIFCFSDLIIDNDFRQFLGENGRLVVSSKIIDTEEGRAILDNYFLKRNSVYLGDIFENFMSNSKQFSITNHLNSGFRFDKICTDAEKAGFSTLPMRTFLDHSLFYLTYLKQAGTGAIPFEFEYSHHKDLFVVNINMSVRDFFAEYLMGSFENFNASNPSQYLMKILSQTCDYLDICYLAESSKIILKAFWNKDQLNKVIQGIGFHHVETATKAMRRIEREIREFEFEEPGDHNSDLFGKLIDLKVELAEDSILSKNFDEILSQLVADFNNTHPEKDIAILSMKEMIELLPTQLGEDLSDQDKKVLLEKAQKSSLETILNDQIEVMKEQFSDDEEFQEEISLVAADAVAEEVIKEIKGDKLSEFLENTLVKGKKEDADDDFVTIGGDSELEKDDDIIRIKSGPVAADNFMQVVKGLKKEEKDLFVKKFSQAAEKDPVFIISGKSGHDLNHEMKNFVVKALKSSEALKDLDVGVKGLLRESAPNKLADGLLDFATKLGVGIEDLSSEQIERFKAEELPLIISKLTDDSEAIDNFSVKIKGSNAQKPSAFDFDKMSLKDPSASEFSNALQDNIVLKVKKLGTELSESEMQQALKETVKAKVAFIINDSELTKEQKEEQKKKLVNEMAETLGLTKDEVEALINSTAKASNEKVKVLIQDKMNSEGTSQVSGTEAQVLVKLKRLEQENSNLQKNLEHFKIKADASEFAQKKVTDLNQVIKDGNSIVVESQSQSEYEERISAQEKSQLLKKLSSGEALSPAEMSKIDQVFKQEQLLHDKGSEIQKDLRKLELETGQKEIVFTQEIERFEKALKEKELVVEKSKQSMRSAISRKEEELVSLKNQVNTLSQKLQNDESTQLKSQVKALLQEKEILQRSSDVYKKKVEELAKSANVRDNVDSPEFMAEENRMLKRAKAALEKKAQSAIAENRKLEVRFQKAASNEMRYKVENQKVLTEFKAAQLQIKNLKEKSKVILGNAHKKVSDQSEQVQRDLDLHKTKNLELSESLKKTKGKLAEAQAQLKLVPNPKELEDNIAAKYSKNFKKASQELESVKSQNAQLQTKLQSLLAKLNADAKSDESGDKSNASQSQKRLERSVKKLNSDLVKAQSESGDFKKEVLKSKKEITGLQNQLAALKRELEKAKKQAVIADKKSKAA